MKGQNTSSAVMQQRKEARDALDDFPTPPWATRAMCEWLKKNYTHLDQMVCREPCANRGYMVEPLNEYFSDVLASDVHDYGAGFPVEDYLFGPEPTLVDFTMMNPPFRLAQQFIERALATSKVGCVRCFGAFGVSGRHYTAPRAVFCNPANTYLPVYRTCRDAPWQNCRRWFKRHSLFVAVLGRS